MSRSDKNRRESIRNIAVGNKSYQWMVANKNCDGDGGFKLKIWYNKQLIYSDLESGSTIITPKNVSEIIKTIYVPIEK